MPPRKKKAARPAPAVSHNADPVAAARLRSFVERIERLDTEIKDLNADKAEVYAEAKGTGFDTKIMRQVIRRRAMEEPDRKEQDELLELYEAALAGALTSAPVAVPPKPPAAPAAAAVPPAPAAPPAAATAGGDTSFLDNR
jgi:uncharacterized protein (UPF0335 family)